MGNYNRAVKAWTGDGSNEEGLFGEERDIYNTSNTKDNFPKWAIIYYQSGR